ncbi:MAG: FISUMP domain-containing protein, partial [Bacteroidota bacterium]
YVNTYGCNSLATQTINVAAAVPFGCGNIVTDIRNNISYPTVQIGLQCWMASNLNYGNTLSSATMQRDNCTTEKYCFNDQPGNCATYGGMYQWDELMRYDNTAAPQGVCLPGWHIPSETEWKTLFNFYFGRGFAGDPLKSTGFSGFNSTLDGAGFKNVNWNFLNFALFYWSSTAHGNFKALAQGMNNLVPSVSLYPSARNNAFYIRCLKD